MNKQQDTSKENETSDEPIVSAEQEEFADHWFVLNNLSGGKEKKLALRQQFLTEISNALSDSAEFPRKALPVGVANLLSEECDAASNEEASSLFKSAAEALRSPDSAQTAIFAIKYCEWQKSEQNPAYIFQTLSIAYELNILPPLWVIDALLKAGNRVYQSDGEVGFDEALRNKPGKIKRARDHEKKCCVANMMAEAKAADLPAMDCCELINFEIESVFGWENYTPSTLQKYYEKYHTDDKFGFGRSFQQSFVLAGYEKTPEYHSHYLHFWRRKVLKARLEAYREIFENVGQKDVEFLERIAEITHFVARKTASALSRNQPSRHPKTSGFLESDY